MSLKLNASLKTVQIVCDRYLRFIAGGKRSQSLGVCAFAFAKTIMDENDLLHPGLAGLQSYLLGIEVLIVTVAES